jgi:arylsulfatase A-like enzyme
VQKNLILIVVDTLRADHLACYGYHRETSPSIDALAARGIRFQSCFSQAPWTIPSFTTVMSGIYPEAHRVVSSPWNIPNANTIVFNDNVPVLAELLQASGYQTIAFDNLHQMASHPKWFVRGFDHYINLTRRPGLFHHHVRASEVQKAVESWLSSCFDLPVFIFLHYWEPHLPYNQEPPYDSWFRAEIDAAAVPALGGEYVPRWGYVDELTPRALEAISSYDGEIRYLDGYIERLLVSLEQHGILQNSVVVFSADHGESMVEHGILFDHQDLYEPTVHVPLIVTDSSANSPRGLVVPDLVEHVDLVPTLLDFLDVPLPPGLNGRSLKSVITGRGPAPLGRAVHATQDGRHPSRMLRTQDWKAIRRFRGIEPAVELYDLRTDPYELVNVAPSYIEIARKMSSQMDEWTRDLLSPMGLGDPFDDVSLNADFFQYPGDPDLAFFYRWLNG